MFCFVFYSPFFFVIYIFLCSFFFCVVFFIIISSFCSRLSSRKIKSNRNANTNLKFFLLLRYKSKKRQRSFWNFVEILFVSFLPFKQSVFCYFPKYLNIDCKIFETDDCFINHRRNRNSNGKKNCNCVFV